MKELCKHFGILVAAFLVASVLSLGIKAIVTGGAQQVRGCKCNSYCWCDGECVCKPGNKCDLNCRCKGD